MTELNRPDASNVTLDADRGPVGIGGWLILPVIGLFFCVFGYGAALVGNMAAYQSALALPDAVRLFLLVEILVNVFEFILALMTIYLLFKKDKSFPETYIFLLLSSFLFGVADHIMTGFLLGASPPDDLKRILHSLVLCAIWIPYMLRSRRVRNTFVRG